MDDHSRKLRVKKLEKKLFRSESEVHTMEENFWKRGCDSIIYKGLFLTDGMLEYAIKRNWSVQRNNVKYKIEIETLFNCKTVQINTDKKIQVKKMYEMLCKILSFECLYDGRFFDANSVEIDGEDHTAEIKKHLLSYYSGNKYYTKFSQPLNDTKYKSGFCAWERFDKKYRFMNQMYHYVGYGLGATADLRLALFSEIFEPLSEILEEQHTIKVISTRLKKPNDPTFADKIRAVMMVYGVDTLFANDDIEDVIKKTVNTRNKLLHVNVDKEETLTGGECGFYIKKYVDMYRIILMKNLGIYSEDNQKELEDSVKKFNENFPQLRIKKKRVLKKKTN